MRRRPPRSTLFPYTTLSDLAELDARRHGVVARRRRVAKILGEDSGARGKSHAGRLRQEPDRKSTRLNSSHLGISYAVFCLKKKRVAITCADDDHTSVTGHLK